jgi:predicted O-methyltransferase YrrM
MTEYRALTTIPPLVKRAKNLAKQIGSVKFCSDQTGHLLQILASQIPSGVIGEIGSGCSVASAWLANAISPATSFFIVESNPAAAATAGALFAPMLNVRVIHSKWREFLTYWQFSMFYASPASAREREPELFLEALRPGGMIILDGLTPLRKLPAEKTTGTIRDFWLNDERLISSEIMVSENESIILATLNTRKDQTK